TKQRQEKLMQQGLLSREQFETTTDELDYVTKLLANIKSRQALENRIREDRMQQISTQISQLEGNLRLVQNSYENLLVRAPISGQLTSFTAEIGENKIRGQRLGQIDVADQYKVVAQIDEFYVTRVAQGQMARFTLSNQEYT